MYDVSRLKQQTLKNLNNKYNYNPFAGVLDDDIAAIIVPIFNCKDLIHQIQSDQSLAIEFLGKKGRGKTTHLRYLQKILYQYPIYLLDKNSSFLDVIKDQSPIVFIDSIHHLNFLERVRLFRSKKVIIYTTHWSRKLEAFVTKKKIISIKFKGINEAILTRIIHKRLHIAAKNNINYKEDVSKKEMKRLIKKNGDNYSNIINYLFELYQ